MGRNIPRTYRSGYNSEGENDVMGQQHDTLYKCYSSGEYDHTKGPVIIQGYKTAGRGSEGLPLQKRGGGGGGGAMLKGEGRAQKGLGYF